MLSVDVVRTMTSVTPVIATLYRDGKYSLQKAVLHLPKILL